jgi:hypothetical protein
VIPKSGLDDLDGAPVVRGQRGLEELLEPERLDLDFRRRGRGAFADVIGPTSIVTSYFHSRNLIPRGDNG